MRRPVRDKADLKVGLYRRRGIVGPMSRTVLALWLALFAVQSSDLLAVVAPDGCVEDARGSIPDPCPDRCAHCVCCARVPTLLPSAVPVVSIAPGTEIAVPPFVASRSTAEPGRVFHVPKAS